MLTGLLSGVTKLLIDYLLTREINTKESKTAMNGQLVMTLVKQLCTFRKTTVTGHLWKGIQVMYDKPKFHIQMTDRENIHKTIASVF